MRQIEMLKSYNGLEKGSKYEVNDDEADLLVKAEIAKLVVEEKAAPVAGMTQEDLIKTITGVLTQLDAVSERKSKVANPAEAKEPRSLGEWFKELAFANSQSMDIPADRKKSAVNILVKKYETEFNRSFDSDFSEGLNRDAAKVAKSMGYAGDTVQKASALGETSSGLGGALVPFEFMPQLMTLIENQADLMPKCRQVPMNGTSLTFPALDYSLGGSGANPFLAGMKASWGTDGATFNQQNPNFRQIELKPNILSGYTVASKNLVEDSPETVGAILSELISQTAAFYIDYAILFGSGANQPLGVFNAPATISVNRAGTANGNYNTDLTAMNAKMLRSKGKSSPFWITSPSVEQLILEMTDSTGRLIFLPNFPNPTGGQVQSNYGDRLYKYPYIVSQLAASAATAGDLFLLDLDKYFLGMRKQLEVQVSDQVNFLSYQLVWRFILRCDGKPWLNTSLTLQNGDVVSPFVYRN